MSERICRGQGAAVFACGVQLAGEYGGVTDSLACHETMNVLVQQLHQSVALLSLLDGNKVRRTSLPG